MNSDDNTIMTKIGGIGVYTIRLIFLMGQVACKMFVSYGLTYMSNNLFKFTIYDNIYRFITTPVIHVL